MCWHIQNNFDQNVINIHGPRRIPPNTRLPILDKQTMYKLNVCHDIIMRLLKAHG